jgi:hypothetical protein
MRDDRTPIRCPRAGARLRGNYVGDATAKIMAIKVSATVSGRWVNSIPGHVSAVPRSAPAGRCGNVVDVAAQHHNDPVGALFGAKERSPHVIGGYESFSDGAPSAMAG